MISTRRWTISRNICDAAAFRHHTFLWYIFGDVQLSVTAAGLLQDLGNDKVLSIASPWEMGIKISTGKLALSDPFDRMLIAQSLVEGVPIISADAVFDAYGVVRHW